VENFLLGQVIIPLISFPFESVEILCSAPVESFLMVTVAFGMTAWRGSKTVSEIELPE